MHRLLFGLGNPGKRYEPTRHNAGWQVLDQLAERYGSGFRATRLVHGAIGDIYLGDRTVRMIKPSSYMNRVGPVFLRALDVFDVSPEQSLVLVDDFQLDFGHTRFRASGSAGGHNGLKSIEAVVGKDYPRLRLGVGPAPKSQEWVDYVLKGYDVQQKKALPAALDHWADGAEAWVREGLAAAMSRFNGAPKSDSADA